MPSTCPNAPHRFVAQAYADDLAVVATSAAGLQRAIDILVAHSRSWGWCANLHKTHIVPFMPGGPPAISAPQLAWWWESDPIPIADHTKYLGVWIEADGSWNRHLQHVQHCAWNALHRWRPALTHPVLHVNNKAVLVKQQIVPQLRYAIEVWGPYVQPPALRTLDAVINSALDCMIPRGCAPWTAARRLVRWDTLRMDCNIPTMALAPHTALLRYARLLAKAGDPPVETPAPESSAPRLPATSGPHAPALTVAIFRHALAAVNTIWAVTVRRVHASVCTSEACALSPPLRRS